ncbi:methyltransferase [Marispirochaeta sp.]|uniref:methyltransferase n=1 Tax=Marispirochaeta sp. TaxID=2038653 RepID=UPI0029C95D48|nr:methyltransferase [Marispirochaeta sp.]
MIIPAELINKRVPFQFMGERLFFDLSHALFSSFKIDDGSRLLLKTLAKHGNLATRRSILDVGCGVGTLGLSLKKAIPDAKLALCDRDALAVEMSLHNAGINTIAVDSADTALMHCLDMSPCDMLVSNVPAKAGGPVHQAFVSDLAGLLNPGGIAALVIVSPLEDAFRKYTADAEIEILYEEKTANHLVLHLSAAKVQSKKKESPEALGAAFRRRGDFELARLKYSLETVYGLPEFDTPSYGPQAAAAISGNKAFGKTLFINPGQGHLAVRLAFGNSLESAILAGRDLLQLATAARNLAIQTPELPVKIHPAPFPAGTAEIKGPFDRICMALESVPGVPPGYGMQELQKMLKNTGELLVYGKSAEIHLFLKGLTGFELRGNRKYRGFRAVLLRNSAGRQA